MKYRHKLIEVDAFQFGVDPTPQWFIDDRRVTIYSSGARLYSSEYDKQRKEWIKINETWV